MDDLLDLRQLREGVFTLAHQPFNANEVFDMIVFTFGPQAAAKGVRITLEYDSSILPPGEDSLLMTKKS